MNKIMHLIISMSLVLILVVTSISLGFLAKDDIQSKINDFRYGNINSPEECKNLTMMRTAYCLNDYVREIFKYKVRPDNEKPTLEELIEDGGDCKNWAELYVGYIQDLGFDAKRPVIRIGNISHTFAIISDDTGYCILDQTGVNCFALGEVKPIKELKESK